MVDHSTIQSTQKTFSFTPRVVTVTTPLEQIISSLIEDVDVSKSILGMWDSAALVRNDSYLLIEQNGEISGIITLIDIVRASCREDFQQLTAEDIMFKPYMQFAIQQVQDLSSTLTTYQQCDLYYLPVSNEAHILQGLITPIDLLHQINPPQILKLKTIEDSELTQLPLAKPGSSALELAQLMSQSGANTVVVAISSYDNQRVIPLGIVTAADIVNLIHQGICLSTVMADALMSDPHPFLHPLDSQWCAFEEIRQSESSLLVCNTEGHLLGAITPLQILKSIDFSEMRGSVRDVWNRLETKKMGLLQHRNAELERQLENRTTQLEQHARRLREELQCSRLLSEIALRIQQSWNLQDILKITVDEMRTLLNCDRTLIYCVGHQENTPTINAQSVIHPNLSVDHETLATLIESMCEVENHHLDDVYIINNIEQSHLPQRCLELLKNLHVQSNLIVPILQENQIWGFLIAQHCSYPNVWQIWAISIMKQLATQVSIAIQKSELYTQLQQELAERKETEISLKRSNEKLEFRVHKFVDQTNDWVWEINSDFKLSYTNPQILDLIGYTPSEVISHSFLDFMSEDEAIRFDTVLRCTIAERQSFQNLEITLQHKEGHPVVLEASATPVFDSEEIWQGYWGIARDITHRKQIEREMRRALTKEKELGELKNRFISMASHEFRTPLTTILASAESLEHYRHRWDDSKILIYLHRIQKTVKHMNGLLDDVLTVGKANADKLSCTLAPLQLLDFCNELVSEHQLDESKQKRINFTYIGANKPVLADEKLLRHILSNLLSNALKYSPPSTQPKFTVNVTDSRVELSVSDQGIGIPEHDLKRLFEPFHRAANVGTIPGTGLGLAIVKKSVDAHGGSIEVESIEGNGTTFTIHLFLKSASTQS